MILTIGDSFLTPSPLALRARTGRVDVVCIPPTGTCIGHTTHESVLLHTAFSRSLSQYSKARPEGRPIRVSQPERGGGGGVK